MFEGFGFDCTSQMQERQVTTPLETLWTLPPDYRRGTWPHIILADLTTVHRIRPFYHVSNTSSSVKGRPVHDDKLYGTTTRREHLSASAFSCRTDRF